MTRATRPFDEHVFEEIITAVTNGALIATVCPTLDVLPIELARWCRSVLTRRTRLDEARILGKLVRQEYKTSRPKRDRESPRSEYQALRDLETTPLPAGKEHYFVMQASGRRSCAHCGVRTPLPSLRFSEGRCAPVGGVYYGGVRVPMARRSSAR